MADSRDTQEVLERRQARRIVVAMVGLALPLGVIAGIIVSMTVTPEQMNRWANQPMWKMGLQMFLPIMLVLVIMFALIWYVRPLRRYVEGGLPLMVRRQ